MSIIPFTPSQISSFQAQVTLDQQVYTIIVTWNVFGKRFYLNVYALDGSRVLTTPMVGSDDSFPINLVSGIAEESTLAYFPSSGSIVVTP